MMTYAVRGLDGITGIIHSERWRSGVPLGGIGCGKIDLLTDGSFGNFTINHAQDKPTGWMKGVFAAVFAETNKEKACKMLRLAGDEEYCGVENIAYTEYEGLFPRVRLSYKDPALPVDIKLHAFSPLIPNNIDDSSLPGACFEFEITNRQSSETAVSLALTWENILGIGGSREEDWNCTEGNYQEAAASTGRLSGVLFATRQNYEDRRKCTLGSYFLGVEEEDGADISICTAWNTKADTPEFWNQFASTGMLSSGTSGLGGAAAAKVYINPGETKNVRFYLVWFTPYHITVRGLRPPKYEIEDAGRVEDVGHYYLNRFSNPIQIADYLAENKDRLFDGTLLWQQPVLESNLPQWLKTKLINCAFSLTVCGILTKDGRFVVMESPVTMNGACGTMDQRMAAHAFMTQLFPELDMREMEIFARCQDLAKPAADGRIPHFDGNIHDVIGDPNVDYGVTDWPDLSCSFIMQTLKLYRWTGDRSFLERMYPHVVKALEFLEAADSDGDFIPEGGSTYDYVEPFPGAFCFTASCYAGALNTAMEMARVIGDSKTEIYCRERLKNVKDSMMKNLWNGRYFMKQYLPASGEKNPNSFIAQLAGDWLSRLCGVGSIFPEETTESTVREIIARHVKPWKPVPPMEVTPDGRIDHSTCFILQHEPYAGCEAIYQGYTADGLDVIYRVYQVAWEVTKSPWDMKLAFDAPDGGEKWLSHYMTCPTTWHVLNALTGTTLDLPNEALYVDPRVSHDLPELHMPVYFSRFWVWFDYVPEKILRLKVTKVFQDNIKISRILDRECRELLKLNKPFIVTEGAELNLDNLAGGFLKPKTVGYEIKAECGDAAGEKTSSDGPVVSG